MCVGQYTLLRVVFCGIYILHFGGYIVYSFFLSVALRIIICPDPIKRGGIGETSYAVEQGTERKLLVVQFFFPPLLFLLLSNSIRNFAQPSSSVVSRASACRSCPSAGSCSPCPIWAFSFLSGTLRRPYWKSHTFAYRGVSDGRNAGVTVQYLYVTYGTFVTGRRIENIHKPLPAASAICERNTGLFICFSNLVLIF